MAGAHVEMFVLHNLRMAHPDDTNFTTNNAKMKKRLVFTGVIH